jgi:hypothetical protein
MNPNVRDRPMNVGVRRLTANLPDLKINTLTSVLSVFFRRKKILNVGMAGAQV